jgi:hypothetical protein
VIPDLVAELQSSVGIAGSTFPERLARTSPQTLYRAVLPSLAAAVTPPPLAAAAEQAGLTVEQAAAALPELAAEEAHRALDRPGMTGDVLTVSDAHASGVGLFADLPAR